MSRSPQNIFASGRKSGAALRPAICRQLFWVLALGAALLHVPAAGAQEAVSKEDQIKAAFLYNIPKFVHWPARSADDMADPIVIGLLSDGALQRHLENIVKDRKINGRVVLVRQVASADEIKAIHLLFVRAADDDKFAALGAAIQDSPVLTTGESAAFAHAGGMVNFVLVGDVVRFEINVAAAEHAQLKISAQLLKLATSVRRAP